MSERKELTDEEYDRRMVLLEKLDDMLGEANLIVRHAGIFDRTQQLWFESFTRDQFDLWHDACIATWNYDHDKNPNAE